MTTITTPPADVPDINDPPTFAPRSATWVAWQAVAIPEINAVAGEINTDKAATVVAKDAAVAAQAAAEAVANYVGEWDDQTGAATVPVTVSHNGNLYYLTTNIADITAKEPGVDAEWGRVYDEGIFRSDEHATLTAGYDIVPEDLGTASGTVTPEVDATGKPNIKKLVNNAAFTLTGPSTSLATNIRIRLINGASAGAIDTSAFDEVYDPDGYVTTSGKEYWLFLDHDDTRDTLAIREIV